MTGLQWFISIVTLFTIGSVSGWVIEVLFRRIFTAKKWINPGFMVGPYLPLYGFGTVYLFLISNIDFSSMGGDTNPWVIVIKILIIGVGMTLIELIAGLIFIKGMHIKLWDYSNRWGNFQGIICPLFSFLWLVVGTLYFFLVNPYLSNAITYLADNQIFYFFFGIIMGCIIVDCCYSMHLATVIRKSAVKYKLDVSYEKLKASIQDFGNEIKKKGKKRIHYVLPFNSNKSVDQMVNEYKDSKYNSPSKKWWKKVKEKRDLKKENKSKNKENDES